MSRIRPARLCVALSLLAATLLVVALAPAACAPAPTPTPTLTPTPLPTATATAVPPTPVPTATATLPPTPTALSLTPTAAPGQLESPDDVQRIGVLEAQALLEDGRAVLVDVRSYEAYAEEHAVGALAMPANQLGPLSIGLPRDKALIFYCT